MSNALAIAAVTATLRSILDLGFTADDDLGGTKVTTLPLDKARDSNNPVNQLNVFLYQTLPNAAWRNMDLPQQVMPGEAGLPPLALNLCYLVTAYGSGDDVAQPYSHQVLGKAMSLLHDHAVLGPDEIKAATIALPRSDLDRQVERVRITLLPQTPEDLSKLWTGFQTQYRLSAAYLVTVVLIESTRPAHTPLPVLTRGPQDRGVGSQADVIPPFPALEAVLPATRQPSARPGETLILNGRHLDGLQVGVVFSHPSWTTPVEIAPAGAAATTLTVTLPDPPVGWPAGFYTVAVQVQRPGESSRRTTNQLSFALAPAITAPITAQTDPSSGETTFTVTCKPPVGVEQVGDPQQGTVIRLAQHAALLVGDLEILARPPAVATTPTATLTFVAAGVVAGDYFARLRIDGVDSLLVDRSVTPPVFDQSQNVHVP